MELIGVETCLVAGQWANVCPCGVREQLGEGDKRMLRCSKCKEAYYCDVECQKEDWKAHKGRCEVLRIAAEKNAALTKSNVA